MRIRPHVYASMVMVQTSSAPPDDPFPARLTLEEMRDAFAAMRGSVTTISDPDEKERWMANVDLWRTYLTYVHAALATDAGKLTVPLDVIRSNLMMVDDAGERERWLANLEMWQLIAREAEAGITADQFDAPFARMRTSIATIHDPADGERWHASRELWDGVIATCATAR